MKKKQPNEQRITVLYARLSRDDEKDGISGSIQNQRAILEKFAADNHLPNPRFMFDDGYSGVTFARPAFMQIMELAEQGLVANLVVKDHSRLGRNRLVVGQLLEEDFVRLNVRYIAIMDNIDTANGVSDIVPMQDLFNEWHAKNTSDKVRRVMQSRGNAGIPLTTNAPYGYKKDPANKNHIIIDPEAAEVVRQIFQWSLEGRGKQNIAAMLNDAGVPNPTRYKAERGWTCNYPAKNDFGLWNKTTIWRILHNEMYTGVMIQGRRKKVSYKSKVLIDVPKDQWYRVEGTHEAIIDRETFDTVQQNLALRSKTDGNGEVHLLSGLVKCMDCGSTMSKTTNCQQGRPRVSYLRCKLYADSGKSKLCTRHSIRLDKLEELVSDRIRYYIQTYYKLEPLDIQPSRDTQREALEQKQKALKAQLEKRSQALKTLYLDKVSGILTDGQFTDLNHSFLEEKARLEQRLSKIEAEFSDQEKPQQQADLMERAKELLKLETVPRELVVALVEKIEIGERNPDTGEQQVRITWKF